MVKTKKQGLRSTLFSSFFFFFLPESSLPCSFLFRNDWGFFYLGFVVYGLVFVVVFVGFFGGVLSFVFFFFFFFVFTFCFLLPLYFRWLIYEEPGFQGVPLMLEPGEYPNLAFWEKKEAYIRSMRPLKMVKYHYYLPAT